MVQGYGASDGGNEAGTSNGLRHVERKRKKETEKRGEEPWSLF
jgi:hypothetical protein